MTAKRHMIFHAFNVVSHASVGFLSRGICREATRAELREAEEETLRRRLAALKAEEEARQRLLATTLKQGEDIMAENRKVLQAFSKNTARLDKEKSTRLKEILSQRSRTSRQLAS